MTAELQVQPRVFWEAAKEQRPSFEIMRPFKNREVTDAQERALAMEREKSRAIFEKAWQDWAASGGKDVRQIKKPRSGDGER